MLTSLARWGGASLLAALAVSAAPAQTAPPQPIRPVGGTTPAPGTPVALDGLKSLAPAAWVPEKAVRPQVYHFRLPKQKNDATDAEVSVVANLTGTPDDNIRRWKAQFVPPPGMPPAEAARVTSFSTGPAQITYLDVQGTYLHKDRPAAPKVGDDVKPGQRMLAVVFQTPEGTYLIRMFGPKATVAVYQKGFEEFIKSFK
jgi:hypothetical protein